MRLSSGSLPHVGQGERTARQVNAGRSTFAGKRVHLIGVAGCGMRALAGALVNHGAIVSGSDLDVSGHLRLLERKGVRCWSGHDPNRLVEPVDHVVVSAAIGDDNPELVKLRAEGAAVIKYAKMLGMLMDQYTGIAISGTHGKSTTTAMTAYLLRRAGLDPSFVVGANVDQLAGASGVGDGEYFVAEACEYDRSFLNLKPKLAAVLNIEEDHLDYYADLDEIVAAFRAFVGLVCETGRIIINGDDENARKLIDHASVPIETFGVSEECHWRPDHVEVVNGGYQFRIVYRGDVLGPCDLRIPGKHNVFNAIAAAGLAYHCGVDREIICHGLAEFQGADRRLALKARVAGVTILDDYAHHPTEIRASLRAAREKYHPARLWCVFQPHQHSRTRFLLDDFAESFADADRVIVPDIFFVRDSESEQHMINSGDLVAKIAQLAGTACYLPRFDQILEYLKAQLAPGDLVITMGAGNIWEICDELIRWLGRDRN